MRNVKERIKIYKRGYRITLWTERSIELRAYVKSLAGAGDDEGERGRSVYLETELSPQAIRRVLSELETSGEVELLSSLERVYRERPDSESDRRREGLT